MLPLNTNDNSRFSIILIISGTIAAPKSILLSHKIRQAGYNLYIIKSHQADNFLKANDQIKCNRTEMFNHQFYGKDRPIWHTDLAKEYDLLVVYSASANFIAKASHGFCDDASSLSYISFYKQKFLFPAMNDKMWKNPIIQKNCKILSEAPTTKVFTPKIGLLACSHAEYLIGRAWEPKAVFEKIEQFFQKKLIINN